MTIDQTSSGSLIACVATPRHFSRNLRLVRGAAPLAGLADSNTSTVASPCLVLKSAIGDKNIVNSAVLQDLFKSLLPSERIEFAHAFHRNEGGHAPSGKPYRLRIRVAAAPHRLADLKARVALAFECAFPGFHFVPGGAPSVEGLEHIAQFALAGLTVAEKPLAAKYSAGEAGSLARFMPPGKALAPVSLPFPADLPNWPLSTPFTVPLAMPRSSEIILRIHGFSLDEAACAALYKTLFRLQAGNLAVFHPDSAIAEYSVATHLNDAALDLGRQWLQHPSGFALDCVVRSSEPLSDAAQQRIVSDVFGQRPVKRVRAFQVGANDSLASPEFAWAIHRGLGLPALLPAQSVLLPLGVTRHYAPPLVPPPQSGSLLGSTVCGARSSKVHLPHATRAQHVAILGATGAGKSALMAQMIAQDLADPDRRCGVGLIDPHGTLFKQVLQLVPKHRQGDVILVDVEDNESTVCINPMEGMKDDPLHANFVVDSMMSLIEMLFEGRDTSGPVMRSNLRNLLLLSASIPKRHSSLMDTVRLIEDIDYAEYLMAKCNNRNVVDYWKRFKATTGSEHGYASWAPYLMARLTPFVASPIMKRMINCPDSTIDLRTAMQERKVVLFNLNKGVLGEIESQLLGSIVLSKFFAAAMARGRNPSATHAPFHLYVDEFASYANDGTPRLFSEARKFGLCLNVAFQSLNQLENRFGRSNVAHALLANCATKFMMRLGPADASHLEAFFKPEFDSAAMSTLPNFHAVASMMDNNQPIPPFVYKTEFAKPDTSKNACVSTMTTLSRLHHGIPIERANRILAETYELDPTSLSVPAASGSRTSAAA